MSYVDLRDARRRACTTCSSTRTSRLADVIVPTSQPNLSIAPARIALAKLEVAAGRRARRAVPAEGRARARLNGQFHARRHRLPAGARPADRQRAGRRDAPADPDPVVVLRARRHRRPARDHREGAAAAQPRAADPRRRHHHARQAHRARRATSRSRSGRCSATRCSAPSSARACGWRKARRTASRFSRSRPTPAARPSTTACARRSWIVPKRGLPDTLRMRHDAHYVETLAASAGAPVGRLVPIDQVDPNPDQPRQAMGDLAELIASVTEKGIIEPLVVRQRGAALPDHRRRAPLPRRRPGRPPRAAGRRPRRRRCRDAGAGAGREHPAQGPDAVRRSRGDAEPGAALRLHPRGPGQAAGQVADVDHRVAVAEPACRRRSARSAGWPASPTSRCCCRSSARATRRRCWRWSRRSPARARRANSSARKPRSRKPDGPKAFIFAFRPPTKAFNLRLQFNKRNASKDEVISALEEILRELKKREAGSQESGLEGVRRLSGSASIDN